MSIYSIWPSFLGFGLLLLLIRIPVFRRADFPPSDTSTRVSSIDGVRGFLALVVFFHHAVISYQFQQTGAWERPTQSHYYASAGELAVALFFLITAYLFWGRLLRSRGRQDWLRLYVGRIFRIGPLYLILVAAMFCMVAVKTGFVPQVPISDLMGQVGRWLCLGFFNPEPLNGSLFSQFSIAGVTWTLHYEWLFYASLLPLSIFATRVSVSIAFSLFGCILALVWYALGWPANHLPQEPLLAALFFLGMLVASIEQKGWLLPKARTALGTVLFVVALATPMAAFGTAYHIGSVLFAGLAFYLIVSGCSFLGLFHTVAAQRLGHISFGVYLLQGPVLTCTFAIAPIRHFALSSPVAYWLVVYLDAIAVLLCAFAAHIWIERPCIEVGKRLVSRRPVTIGASVQPSEFAAGQDAA